MKHTLYVTDMDGTLLDGDSRVSPRSAEIISRLSQRGTLITVATARTPATVDVLLQHTGIKIPAIVMTGAALWDMQRHCYSHTNFIPAEEISRIVGCFNDTGIAPFVYTIPPGKNLQVYHHGAMSRCEHKFVDERRHLALKQFHLGLPGKSSAVDEPTVLFFGMGRLDAVYETAERINAVSSCSISRYADIFDPSVGQIEVLAPGVSKAAAIRRLATTLGVDEVVVFGDNLNDLSMMRAADRSIAVANALPEIKAVADEVIGYNTADAVARYIERMEFGR